MATHSSILAWRIQWTEEPRGLQSMGSQRVRHSWETNTSVHFMSSQSIDSEVETGTGINVRVGKPDIPGGTVW